jgi:alcohol dehydrogenase YqhD (iron-dependent ADH family)
MNPELTYSVPAYQTAAGAADIFSHTFMRYFSRYDSFLGDEYCIGTLRTVVAFAGRAVARPDDYDARAELMLSAAFAHNDVMGIGRGPGRKGGEHTFEKQLSGFYDTAHGAGLAVMMPAYLTYIVRHGAPEQVARVAEFGRRVFDVKPGGTEREVACEGIALFKNWLRSIGMPVTLGELGVRDDALETAIRYTTDTLKGTIKAYVDIDAQVVDEVYRIAAKDEARGRER